MKKTRLFGIVGWKNSGKTTLVERLISDITKRGYKVSTIKHAHHTFDIDHQGTDSFRHRAAGAKEVLLTSRNRWAVMHELRGEPEPEFESLLNNLEEVDLVLIEGFKNEKHHKLEVIRSENKKTPIFRKDKSIIALATNTTLSNTSLPIFNSNEVSTIADFILKKAATK